MNLTLHIPDDIAARLEASAEDLERRMLERLVAEEYRLGHLHRPDLRRLLGFTTVGQIDGFLNAHDIYDGYTLEEINEQVETLERLGF